MASKRPYFGVDITYHAGALEQRIRHMSDDELLWLAEDVKKDSVLRTYNPDAYVSLLDEIVRVQYSRHEWRKREELRNALIAFLRGNANLGQSLEYAADRIAEAIDGAGDLSLASFDQIGSIIRELHVDARDSELPQLISEMREAIALRNEARRRLE